MRQYGEDALLGQRLDENSSREKFLYAVFMENLGPVL